MKTGNKVIIHILVTVLVMLLIYGCFWFVHLEPNPVEWSIPIIARFITGQIAIPMLFQFILLVALSDYDIDKKETEMTTESETKVATRYKVIMHTLLVPVVVITIYGGFWFLLLEPNPVEWNMGTRGLFIFAQVIGIFLTQSILNLFILEYEMEKRDEERRQNLNMIYDID